MEETNELTVGACVSIEIVALAKGDAGAAFPARSTSAFALRVTFAAAPFEQPTSGTVVTRAFTEIVPSEHPVPETVKFDDVSAEIASLAVNEKVGFEMLSGLAGEVHVAVGKTVSITTADAEVEILTGGAVLFATSRTPAATRVR